MNIYDIAIRLTDGSRKTMTVRATTANAAERMIKERYPVGINKEQSKNKVQLLIIQNYENKSTNSFSTDE